MIALLILDCGPGPAATAILERGGFYAAQVDYMNRSGRGRHRSGYEADDLDMHLGSDVPFGNCEARHGAGGFP